MAACLRGDMRKCLEANKTRRDIYAREIGAQHLCVIVQGAGGQCHILAPPPEAQGTESRLARWDCNKPPSELLRIRFSTSSLNRWDMSVLNNATGHSMHWHCLSICGPPEHKLQNWFQRNKLSRPSLAWTLHGSPPSLLPQFTRIWDQNQHRTGSDCRAMLEGHVRKISLWRNVCSTLIYPVWFSCDKR